ncbi:MAG: ComEC/Rec2 family competence protein [Candidatus Scatomorpha sp.]|jgi:beta-lactamase superfamily II metal-dependent hydrolase
MARRRSGKKRGSVVGTLVFAAALLVMWAASRLGLVSWGGSGEDRVDLSASLPDAGIFVSYIDVGQGDSAFVSCGDDTLLIDAGVSSEGETVVDYLRSLGVTELDYVVCTHAHEDHCGGLDDVIAAFDVGTLFAPYTEFDASGAFTRFEDTAADKGLYVTVPELGAEFTLGDAVFEFVGPVSDWGDDLNDSSLVLRLEYGETAFLFTGDISAGPLEDCALIGGYDLGCDVLKLGHHGSSTSTDAEVLDLTHPSLAIACCGEDNSYGHPHQEVVDLLAQRGITLLRTDTDGTIELVSDGKTVSRAA